MFSLSRVFFYHSRQLAVIASLIFATFLCFGLLILRMIYSHNSQYSWLVWNLFLAWLPTGSALLAYNLHKHHSKTHWAFGPGLCDRVVPFLSQCSLPGYRHDSSASSSGCAILV